MRYLKIAGLLTVAVVALMAVAGAGTAGATVLCKEKKDPCGSDYAAGTSISAQLPAGVSMQWWKFGKVSDTCTASTIVGKTTNTGGSTSNVVMPLSALTWSGCTTARETIKPGTLEFVHINPETAYSARVTLKEAEWKEGPCTYGFSGPAWIGSLKNSATSTSGAEIEIKVLITRLAGAPCAETVEWVARYTVTTPVPLYVSES
jgi:hypothetical protein